MVTGEIHEDTMSGHGVRHSSHALNPSDLFVFGLLVLVVVATYLWTLTKYFYADDFGINVIIRSNTLAWFSPHWSWGHVYRPLSFVAATLRHVVLGEWATGHYLFNMAIHAVTSFLVYLLGLRLWRRKGVALAAALSFATFWMPLQVVYYITVANEMGLSVLCCLLSLLSFDRYLTRARPSRYWASWIFFTAALYLKEVAVTWILILEFWECWCTRRATDAGTAWWSRLWVAQRKYIPFFLTLAVYLWLHWVSAMKTQRIDPLLPPLGPYGPTWGTIDHLVRWAFVVPFTWVAPLVGGVSEVSALHGDINMHGIGWITRMRLVSLLSAVGIGWLSILLFTKRFYRFLYASLLVSVLPIALCGTFQVNPQYTYPVAALSFPLMMGIAGDVLHRLRGLWKQIVRAACCVILGVLMFLNSATIWHYDALWEEQSVLARSLVTTLRSLPPGLSYLSLSGGPPEVSPLRQTLRVQLQRMVDFALFPHYVGVTVVDQVSLDEATGIARTAEWLISYR